MKYTLSISALQRETDMLLADIYTSVFLFLSILLFNSLHPCCFLLPVVTYTCNLPRFYCFICWHLVYIAVLWFGLWVSIYSVQWCPCTLGTKRPLRNMSVLKWVLLYASDSTLAFWVGSCCHLSEFSLCGSKRVWMIWKLFYRGDLMNHCLPFSRILFNCLMIHVCTKCSGNTEPATG